MEVEVEDDDELEAGGEDKDDPEEELEDEESLEDEERNCTCNEEPRRGVFLGPIPGRSDSRVRLGDREESTVEACVGTVLVLMVS